MRPGHFAAAQFCITGATLVLLVGVKGQETTNENATVIALVRQLEDDNESNRLAAAEALIKVGPSTAKEVAGAVSFLGGKKADLALDAFVSAGPKAVPMMLALVRGESNGDLRENSGVSGIFRIGSNAVPGLEIAMNSKDPKLKTATINVLRIIAAAPEMRQSSARLLIRAAKTEKDDWLRLFAIDALGYFGLMQTAPADVCDTLRELLRDPFEKARLTAAYSLAKSCPGSAAAATLDLVKGISNEDEQLAWESAFALHHLGTNALAVLPELSRALDHMNGRVADEVTQVLAHLGDAAFPTLQREATNVARDDLRVDALNGLGDFCTSSKTNLSQAIELLSNAVKDANRDARAAALNSLRRAALERKESNLYGMITEIIRPMLNDKDEWIRDDAKRALAEIKSASERTN